ncbi:MAG: hypothetical protein AB9834_20100 [Lentimicrobium sp.]
MKTTFYLLLTLFANCMPDWQNGFNGYILFVGQAGSSANKKRLTEY